MTDDTKPAPAVTGKISPKLAEMMASATPEQRRQVIEIASKLLGRRAFREATGQTDLTKPFDPHAKVILAATEYAAEPQAQQGAAARSSAGKLKVLPSDFDQMVSEGSTAWVAVPNSGPAQD